MSKRGAGERDYTPSQGNMRKARVEVRRVDAIQLLMAAARARSNPPQQSSSAVTTALTGTAAAAATAAGAAAATVAAAVGAKSVGPATAHTGPAPSAPCTHCGTVLPVSADSCSLRQCCACLDVFCSLCSVLDYEEREDRVFCLGCLEDQTAASRGGGGGRGSRVAEAGPGSASTAGLLSLPLGSATGRWGQLDLLGAGGHARSPFPCSRTPQQGQGGSRTPGSALYSSRSHRGFSALLGYSGAES